MVPVLKPTFLTFYFLLANHLSVFINIGITTQMPFRYIYYKAKIKFTVPNIIINRCQAGLERNYGCGGKAICSLSMLINHS
jgi:hypothetical protein